jgi:predicted small lipoprotein YifL
VRRSVAVLLVGTALAAALAACGASGSRPPDARAATYVIQGRQVTLARGAASTPAAPGSVSRVRTWIAAGPVAGRLSGDGGPDVAVVLAQDTGGSGTFYYAAALLGDGSARGRATNAVFLGDRVAVTGLSVGGGVISWCAARTSPWWRRRRSPRSGASASPGAGWSPRPERGPAGAAARTLCWACPP